MASPERPPSIEAVADTRKPYPRLAEAQKARILADLLTEYRLNNLRPIRDAGDTIPLFVALIIQGLARLYNL